MPRVGLRDAEVVCAAYGEVVGAEGAGHERLEGGALDGGEIAVAGLQARHCGQEELVDEGGLAGALRR